MACNTQPYKIAALREAHPVERRPVAAAHDLGAIWGTGDHVEKGLARTVISPRADDVAAGRCRRSRRPPED